MAASALQSLAQTSPTLYLNELNNSGTTVLADLHERCGSAGLLSTSAGDDAERLYGVFNVALEHGLGSLVLDYVAQVSFGSGLQPGHPSSPVLSDPQCIAAWLQSSLTAARYDLSTALVQGLPAIASSQIAPRHVAKLQTLVMVAEALASKSFSTTGPAASASRTARRILGTGQLNAPTAAPATALAESPSMLVTEATRLLQTAKIMHWLSTQQLLQTSPSGRFSSHSAWEGTVSRRRAGAAPTPLLLSDLIDNVTQYDVDIVSYPPPSPESLITTLFLSGNATEDAFLAKLAVLCYCLVDANFLKAPDLVKGVHRFFAIPPTVPSGWLLLLFLDDAQLIPMDAPVNSSLNQAINCLPGVDGRTIPFHALRVFTERRRGDVALGLLRQKSQKEATSGNIVAACTALQVRLANGLLVESFIEIKRYLQSLPEKGDKVREQHAQRLISDLLKWGSGNPGGLANIISLSIDAAHEEPALISWLQRSTHSMPFAGIILTLYFLMRGRTPEALLAYAQYGKGAAAAVSDSFGKEACAQVEELLRAACRTMPAAQRALVVGTAPEPALKFSAELDQMMIDGGVDGRSGTALVSALPGLDTGGLPPLISVGPTAAEAPLVGGVMTTLSRATGLKEQGKKSSAEGVREPSMASGKPVVPLLFGQTLAPSSSALRSSATPVVSTQFGAALNVQTQSAALGGAGGGGGLGTSRRQQHHQLDALLGLTPTSRTQATGMKGRRTLR